MNMSPQRAIRFSVLLLRYTFVGFLFIIGIDKIAHTNHIAQWELLVGPVSHTFFYHVPVKTIVLCQGIIEVVLGALLAFTPFVRTAVALFLVSTFIVLVDLVSLGYIILALRDVLVIVSGIALIVLRGAKSEA